MTTQQQPQQPHDLARRVGRLEGLMEGKRRLQPAETNGRVDPVIARVDEVNGRVDPLIARIDAFDRKFTMLIFGSWITLLIAIFGARFIE